MPAFNGCTVSWLKNSLKPERTHKYGVQEKIVFVHEKINM